MITKSCYWRPVSTDLLTDEDFQFVEDNLPDELKTAPYMFYLACLRKADDDGMIDLEDGIIFSRLMRIGTPVDVFKIANLFMKRKIISRIGDSTCCLICDWSYPGERAPRTLEQRRNTVRKKIEEAEQRKQKAFDTVQDAPKAEPSVQFSLCSENDKNSETVVKTADDDKNRKNVVTTEREIDRETENTTEQKIDIKKDTHTKQNTTESDRDKDAAPDLTEKSGYASEDDTTVREMLQQTEVSELPNPGELAEVMRKVKQGKGDASTCFDVLQSFFANKCSLFNPFDYKNELHEIVRRIQQVATQDNPADIIAKVVTQEFFRMTNQEHWYNLPITPDYLLKPSIWSRVITSASKILDNKSSGKKWENEVARYKAEMEADERKNGSICDQIDQQYLDLGIDPTAPNATDLLLQTISRRNREKAKEAEPP